MNTFLSPQGENNNKKQKPKGYKARKALVTNFLFCQPSLNLSDSDFCFASLLRTPAVMISVY